ncbi:hypothetical protein EDD18DRAFT_1108629 [Armillaria luteobubalina]|uniref:Uncharacterized protein n=1 Tax=Armillaria luteobubalina TaxID=153913 RepID=A0AA39UK18_9AGAR|nr:hypothetical protein EDD18DRAFT_1108629 [Armillaria luteobubalina]
MLLLCKLTVARCSILSLNIDKRIDGSNRIVPSQYVPTLGFGLSRGDIPAATFGNLVRSPSFAAVLIKYSGIVLMEPYSYIPHCQSSPLQSAFSMGALLVRLPATYLRDYDAGGLRAANQSVPLRTMTGKGHQARPDPTCQETLARPGQGKGCTWSGPGHKKHSLISLGQGFLAGRR